MLRLIVLVSILCGCAAEGISPPDISSPDLSGAPARSRPLDSGVAPDLVVPDVIPAADAVETPSADVQAPPDAISYTHDVIPTDGTARECLQQVIANGYASDQASCAQLYGRYDAGAQPVQDCQRIIDCYAETTAARCAPTGEPHWTAEQACPCAVIWSGSLVAVTDISSIVVPYCPGQFF